MHLRPVFDGLQRPGLAGGIDSDGSRAHELLGLGFGSVEFGSVLAQHIPAVFARLSAALAQRATNSATNSAITSTTTSAIGIGLGLDAALTPADLGATWCLGLENLARCLGGCPGTVDYLSLNLSAAANRRFLTPALYAPLQEALHQVQSRRALLPLGLTLAVKLPVADALRLASLWPDAGVSRLTVVLPEGGDLSDFVALRAALPALTLVAVGGIRSSAHVDGLRAAGADGLQVHRLFKEHGPACLDWLRSPENHEAAFMNPGDAKPAPLGHHAPQALHHAGPG